MFLPVCGCSTVPPWQVVMYVWAGLSLTMRKSGWGTHFFCRLELASHFTLRICIQKLVNQTADWVLCRYSKRYLFRKSKAPAVSPPKLPYPWKCPQPPIKFLPRLPISTFSLCCDTHGSRAPILKDQAQTTLPKMKMLNFENQVMMVTIKSQAHSCLCLSPCIRHCICLFCLYYELYNISPNFPTFADIWCGCRVFRPLFDKGRGRGTQCP